MSLHAEQETQGNQETPGEETQTGEQFQLVQEQDGQQEPEINISQATADDVIGDLENIAIEEDEPGPVSAAQLPAPAEELTPEQAKVAAQMTAAVATGTIATGVEFFLKPAKVSDEQRNEFKDALAAVLAKSGGVMPEWMARFLDEWQEELHLARKTVAIGWAIKEQVKAEKAKQIDMPAQVPGRGDKPRHRVPKEDTARSAA